MKAGVYARVSKEDSKKYTFSESIENQKRLAQIYVQNSNEDIEIVDYYIDDGKTGTVTDRPAYQQLLQDAQNKKINMIIVKDFSRLSRDTIDALKFIEYDIQKLGVRFVSLGEGFDSIQNNTDDLKMRFLAILNSTYPADISRKVRMNLDMKRQDGKFVGAFAPYGYRKDSKNKYLLVPDIPAANIVQKIYALYLDGMSKQSIAEYLNENGVASPTEYKKQNHSLYQPAKKGYPYYIWTYSTINKILSDEVYIGHLIQKKTKMIKVLQQQKSFKKKIPIEKGNEIRIESTHEAIIAKEIFEKVQKIHHKRRNIKNQQKSALFSALLICGKCHNTMYHCYSKNTKGEKIDYYRCSSYKKKCCSPHSIKQQQLIDIIQYILKIFFSFFDTEYNNVTQKQLTQQLIQQQKRYQEGRKRLLQAVINGVAQQSDIKEYEQLHIKTIKNIEQSIQNNQNHVFSAALLHNFIEHIIIKEFGKKGKNKQINITFAFRNPFLF